MRGAERMRRYHTKLTGSASSLYDYKGLGDVERVPCIARGEGRPRRFVGMTGEHVRS